jgi:hypothetical protein
VDYKESSKKQEPPGYKLAALFASGETTQYIDSGNLYMGGNEGNFMSFCEETPLPPCNYSNGVGYLLSI